MNIFSFLLKDNLTMLLQIMEDFLKEAPRTADYDPVRQNVVILMGRLAKDMDKDSTKVKNILFLIRQFQF